MGYGHCVRNPGKIAPWYRMLHSGLYRAQQVGIGDSQRIYAGFGRDAADHAALASLHPQFATEIFAPSEGNGSSVGMGPNVGVSSSGQQNTFAIAPDSYASMPADWTFFNTVTSDILQGFFVTTNRASETGGRALLIQQHPGDGRRWMDPKLAVTAHWWVAQSASGGSGAATLNVRLAASPFSAVSADVPVVSVAGSAALRRYSVDVPADAARTQPLGIMFAKNASAITAPYGLQFVCGEQKDRPGFQCNSMVSVASNSLRGMYNNMVAKGTEFWKEYFLALKSFRQGFQERSAILIDIVCGANDTGDSNNSIGPNPAPTNTFLGVYDNLQAFRNYLSARATEAGLDPLTELFWLVSSTPRLESGNTTRGYARNACNAFSDNNPNTASFDYDLAVPDQAELQTFWLGGTDSVHFTNAGFLELETRKWTGIAEAVVNSFFPRPIIRSSRGVQRPQMRA